MADRRLWDDYCCLKFGESFGENRGLTDWRAPCVKDFRSSGIPKTSAGRGDLVDTASKLCDEDGRLG